MKKSFIKRYISVIVCMSFYPLIHLFFHKSPIASPFLFWVICFCIFVSFVSINREISNLELKVDMCLSSLDRMIAIEAKKALARQQEEKLGKPNMRKMLDFFTKKSDDKKKVTHLVDYSYRWYLGLRGKDIFEEEIDIQDFLNHIWNCYKEFSAEELRYMMYIEDKKAIKDFYSYHNEEIVDYLPPNVVITISDDGLYEIVKFRDDE